jgi:hypothetical protein
MPRENFLRSGLFRNFGAVQPTIRQRSKSMLARPYMERLISSGTSSPKDDAPPYDAGCPEGGDDITKSGPKSQANAANSCQAAPPITNSAVIRGLQLALKPHLQILRRHRRSLL